VRVVETGQALPWQLLVDDAPSYGDAWAALLAARPDRGGDSIRFRPGESPEGLGHAAGTRQRRWF
jgi:hypothetical protein